MTDADNPTGIRVQEVGLHDKDGSPHDLSNPLLIKDTDLNTLMAVLLPLDAETGYPIVVDEEHAIVHGGRMFHAFEEDLTLNLDTNQYEITVPEGYDAHLVIGVDTHNGVAIVRIFEGATFTGGSAMDIRNKDRSSDNTPNVVVKNGGTSADGDQIDSILAGAGLGAVGSNRARNEWNLKENTTYRIDVEGLDAQTDVVIKFEWYEMPE